MIIAKKPPLLFPAKTLFQSFLISYFSTSPPPSQRRRPFSPRRQRKQEEDSRSVKVSVWWDFENCHLPVGVNVFRVAQNITAAVRANGVKGPVQITAYGNVSQLSEASQDALSLTGIDMVHVPNGGKNSAYRALLAGLMEWVSQNPPPAHLFLISGDRDFTSCLHKLRRKNYDILLAAEETAPDVLCSAASIMWYWNNLLKGENLIGKYINQPPDGPYDSWYGSYKLPLKYQVSVPEHSPSPSPSSLSPKVEEPVDSIRPIPEAVIAQVGQIHGMAVPEPSPPPPPPPLPPKVKEPVDSIPPIPEAVIGQVGQIHGMAVPEPSPPPPPPLPPKVKEPVDSIRPIPEAVIVQVRQIQGMAVPEPSPPPPSSLSPKVKEPVDSIRPIPEAVIAQVRQILSSHPQGIPMAELGAELWRSNVAIDKKYYGHDFTRFLAAMRGVLKLEDKGNGLVLVRGVLDRPHYPSRPAGWRNVDMKDHDQLYSTSYFWKIMEKFVRTEKGSLAITESKTREQMASNLQKGGPYVLTFLEQPDLLLLVDMLISQKKWVDECPSEASPFKVTLSVGNAARASSQSQVKESWQRKLIEALDKSGKYTMASEEAQKQAQELETIKKELEGLARDDDRASKAAKDVPIFFEIDLTSAADIVSQQQQQC